MPPIDPLVLSQKGSLYLTRPTLGHYVATRAELLARAEEVLGWVRDGSLSVRIGREFPLDLLQSVATATPEEVRIAVDGLPAKRTKGFELFDQSKLGASQLCSRAASATSRASCSVASGGRVGVTGGGSTSVIGSRLAEDGGGPA